MNKRRVAILGGGVAGVVLANELIGSGEFDVEILEKTGRLGGLQRSVTIDGLSYDIGSFVFDAEHELLKTFPVLYNSFVSVAHTSLALNPRGSIDRYPMTLRGYIRDNGLPHTLYALVDLLASKAIHWKRDTLVSFIQYYLGSTVYRNSGLKSYIERFYCTSDTNVDLEFARQRLVPLQNDCSLRRNFRNIAADAFDSTGGRKPWVCYVRPIQGFDYVYSIIGEHLESRGVRMVMNCEIEEISRTEFGYDVQCADGARQYDDIISTIPVPVMSGYMGIPTDGGFESMTLISLFYRYRGEPKFDGGYLYNFTHGGEWKRITLFSNYYGRHQDEHYFVVECTRRFADHDSVRCQRLLFEEHVASMGIFPGELRYQGGLITPDAYPFYRRGDMDRVRRAKERLVDAGIYLAGRQGRFDYLNAHFAALTSKNLAGELIGGADGSRG